DRAAGRELHDDECHEHDAEHRRDHEQDATEDIGGHWSPISSCPHLWHASTLSQLCNIQAWMAGTSPAMTALALLFQRRRFVAVGPPGVRNAAEIARLRLRPS